MGGGITEIDPKSAWKDMEKEVSERIFAFHVTLPEKIAQKFAEASAKGKTTVEPLAVSFPDYVPRNMVTKSKSFRPLKEFCRKAKYNIEVTDYATIVVSPSEKYETTLDKVLKFMQLQFY